MNFKIDLTTLVIPSFESIRLESENSAREKRNLLFSTFDPRSLVIPPFRSNANAARVSSSTTGNQSNCSDTLVSKNHNNLKPYHFPSRGGDYTGFKSHSATIKRNLRFQEALISHDFDQMLTRLQYPHQQLDITEIPPVKLHQGEVISATNLKVRQSSSLETSLINLPPH